MAMDRWRATISSSRSVSIVPACVIAFLLLGISVPAPAQAPVLLKQIGEFLITELRSYLIGKAIDRGVDFVTKKRELEDVERSLQAGIAEGNRRSEAGLAELRAQLTATQVQLEVFRKLERGNPSDPAEANRMRQEITDSLEGVKRILEDHERRLQALEREMAELQSRFSSQSRPADQSPRSDLLPPTINCRNARTQADHLMCDDPLLGDADGRLGKAYNSLVFFASRAEHDAIRADERRWIAWRDQQLATVCTTYGRVYIPCAMNLWEQRIQQLNRALNTLAYARSLTR